MCINISRKKTHKFPTVSNSAILSNNYLSLLSDRLSAHAYKRENGVTNEAIVIEWAAAAACEGSEKAMGRCTARLKMLLFRAKIIVTGCPAEERKKEERNKQFARFASA